MGRARAPEVKLAQLRVREAEATRVGAGLVLPANPRLTLEARPSLPQSTYPVQHLGYGATVDFLFDVGGAPSARVREAGLRARSAQADAEVVRFYAGLLAWKLYLAAIIAQQRVDETAESLVIAKRVMAAAQERSSAGAAGDIDVETARLEVVQIQAGLEGAVRERDGHQMGLREVLDLRGDQKLVLTTRAELPPPPPPLAMLIEHAYRTRPELAATRHRMQLIEATDERLDREVFPKIGVYTGVDAAPYSAMFWSVGASVELPVAQRNQTLRAVAARELDTERSRLELDQRRIEREVTAARASYEARRSELTLLRDQAIPAAERNLSLIETGWRSGRFDVFRVTAAARDLVRARALRLEALEAAWLDRIALEQAAGGWPP
ncbi:MAG: TolC family protein [Deltaproteobacteria bacterium]|nr:TolC family protein [Deltaproteobacteria bacterium]